MASKLTYLVVVVGVLYYAAKQRSRHVYQLKQEIQAPPDVCLEYMRTHEEFLMRSHPFMTRVERLSVKETSGHVFEEMNLYETVPLLPGYTRDAVLHMRSDIDLNRNTIYHRIENSGGLNDFMGARIHLTFDFADHSDKNGWTLFTDTISNDFSYGMSFIVTRLQRGVHEKLLQDLREEVEKVVTNN